MAKHLLVWENVPESTLAYVLVEGEDDGLIDMAQQAMGQYVNGTDDDGAANRLSEALEGRKPEYNGDSPIIGPFVAVYIAGFIM